MRRSPRSSVWFGRATSGYPIHGYDQMAADRLGANDAVESLADAVVVEHEPTVIGVEELMDVVRGLTSVLWQPLRPVHYGPSRWAEPMTMSDKIVACITSGPSM